MIAFTLVFLPHLLFQAGAAVLFISAAFPVTLFLVIPISYKLPSFLFLDPSLPTLCFAQGKSKHINQSYSQTLSSFLGVHCSALHRSVQLSCARQRGVREQINREEGGGGGCKCSGSSSLFTTTAQSAGKERARRSPRALQATL